MKKEINPVVAFSIAGVLVLLIVVGYFLSNRTSSATKDVSNASPAETSDASPPRRGQPGYRQRTTDTPVPGTPSGAGGRPGDSD